MEHSEIISLRKHGTKEDSPLKQEKENNKPEVIPKVIPKFLTEDLAEIFLYSSGIKYQFHIHTMFNESQSIYFTIK